MDVRLSNVASLSLLLIVCAMSNIQAQCTDMSILHTGLFHSREVSPTQAGQWLGLCQTPKGWELRQVDVKIERRADIIVGDDRDDPAKWTGWKIAVDNDVEPLFLVRGIPDANLGFVESLFVGKTMVMPGSPLVLGQGESHAQLSARGKRSNDKYNSYGILDYILVLYSGGRSQELVSVKGADPGEDSIEVLWVGDLDADGKLDLLLDTGNHYNVTEYSLYLSSCAQKDELVRCVARFRSVGC
jgi:hypothetical protein